MTYYINLTFLDMGKLDKVTEIVSHDYNVIKYSYKHCYALYLMRKQTCGREIFCLAPTQFATNSISLQSILSHKKDNKSHDNI